MDDMNANEKTRLDRIEEKIDKMADAIIALARAEEKITVQEESTRIILGRMIAQDDRLRLLERDLSHVQDTTKTIRALGWSIATAVIGSIVAAFVWMLDWPNN